MESAYALGRVPHTASVILKFVELLIPLVFPFPTLRPKYLIPATEFQN